MRRDGNGLACVEVTPHERLILDELRVLLGLGSDADLLRTALWHYARGQGVTVTTDTFRLRGAGKRPAATVR